MKIILTVLTLLLASCAEEGTNACDNLQKSSPFYNRFCGDVAQVHIKKAVTFEAQKRIRAAVHKSVRILNQRFDKNFKAPPVAYDAYGKSAGFVIPTDGYSVVHLNPNRAEETIMTTMIVPHEVAHWMVHKLYDDVEPHGLEWKAMMDVLGVDPVQVLKLGD